MGLGYLVKRTVRLGYVPRRRPSGEQGSILLSQSGMGDRSESRARSYAVNPGSRRRDPPVFSAGNPGKSLNTQSSIRRLGRRRKGIAYSFHKVLAKVLPFF